MPLHAVLVGLALVSWAAAEYPNFVIMMADDMGYGDWSRTGAPAHTPHLEEFSRAQNAVWFQRAYSGNPICSPTRASVMTGRTPARTCIWGVEQHILCHKTPGMKGGCLEGEYSIANATREKGYLSGFYGKWHLGSLSNTSKDCYPSPDGKCNSGYVPFGEDGAIQCCQGTDGKLLVSHPLHFGFDEFVATPQCGASATTNCGCFFVPNEPRNVTCEVGHYTNSCSTCDKHLKCAAYYRGDAAKGTVESLDYVSSVDDEDFLVDQFEGLLQRSLQEKRPFLAVLFFHGVHIPYVATPASRALYQGMTENEQDYWGTITQIDAAVGRVRGLLRQHGVENNTWVSITADNGPEVSPAGGQGVGSFVNPGRTDGLRGRKRDVTEGGIREIGIVEFPPLVHTNRVEPEYPLVTMDLMATILDLTGQPSTPLGRTLDGTSLVPFLSQKTHTREAGIGWHGIFRFGSTNHVNGTLPHLCPEYSAAATLGDIPPNFTTPGNQPQFAWAEGNQLKLFGCKDKSSQWHAFLYNLTADRAETTDLWESHRQVATAMFSRFQEWQESVVRSMGPDEIGCNDPFPAATFTPIKGMQNVKERCASAEEVASGKAADIESCAQLCKFSGRDCRAVSFAADITECRQYSSCSSTESGSYVYTWSSYTVA